MTTTETWRDEALDALAEAEYGAPAEYELPDGRWLRVHVEPDDIDPMDEINGVDCWGRVAWCDDRRRMNDYGYPAERPDGFDGDALKLSTYDGSRFWWQPTLEVWGVSRAEWTPGRRREEASRIVELVTWGFKVVVLELCDADRDAYGHLVPREVASLGIDSLEGGYLRSVVADLLDELGC